MQELVAEGAGHGGIGLSLGLLYAPGCFTPAEEIASLAAALSEPRRLVFHVRNECDRFEESVREAIEIGRQARVAVHISHLKVADPGKNHGIPCNDVFVAREAFLQHRHAAPWKIKKSSFWRTPPVRLL